MLENKQGFFVRKLTNERHRKFCCLSLVVLLKKSRHFLVSISIAKCRKAYKIGEELLPAAKGMITCMLGERTIS